jgi:RNA polymerase sigma factor (sigma-70 family)
MVFDDHQLMISVRSGETERLGQLFEAHHKRLYNYFLNQTGNRLASEDLVGDVFFRMLKYRHTYKDEGKFLTWMYAIARNARIDYYRGHNVRSEFLEEPDNLTSNAPNPGEKYEQLDDITLLRRAMAELPDDRREVILMSRFNHMRYKEIGEILGCTVGTVKVRVYRAMKDLAERYFRLAGEKSHEM